VGEVCVLHTDLLQRVVATHNGLEMPVVVLGRRASCRQKGPAYQCLQRQRVPKSAAVVPQAQKLQKYQCCSLGLERLGRLQTLVVGATQANQFHSAAQSMFELPVAVELEAKRQKLEQDCTLELVA
jgi:hypothetical protein